jgi:hypothetical protein
MQSIWLECTKLHLVRADDIYHRPASNPGDTRYDTMLAALLLTAAVANFDVYRFFAGETAGVGELKVVLRSREPVRVKGIGRIDPDGTLILDQEIAQGTRPLRTRQWRLRRVGPGRYQGSLSDARGMVDGAVDGPRLHLRFSTKDGFDVEQWLTIADDGRSAANTLKARRFGITVATLTEKITKLN